MFFFRLMHDLQMIIKSVGEGGPIAEAFKYIVTKIGKDPSTEDKEEMDRLRERVKSLSKESADLLNMLQLRFHKEFYNERKREKGSKGSFLVSCVLYISPFVFVSCTVYLVQYIISPLCFQGSIDNERPLSSNQSIAIYNGQGGEKSRSATMKKEGK